MPSLHLRYLLEVINTCNHIKLQLKPHCSLLALARVDFTAFCMPITYLDVCTTRFTCGWPVPPELEADLSNAPPRPPRQTRRVSMSIRARYRIGPNRQGDISVPV